MRYVSWRLLRLPARAHAGSMRDAIPDFAPVDPPVGGNVMGKGAQATTESSA